MLRRNPAAGKRCSGIRKLLIYTDGGCSGNPGPGGWAYLILESEGAELTREAGWEADTTNNRMELLAVISALKTGGVLLKQNAAGCTDKQDTLLVRTDSQYVQKGITQWINNWKRVGWKTSDKKPVKNQDLWQELDNLAAGLPLVWEWVKGHAGNEYNEQCDSMVKEAISCCKKTFYDIL